jgi:hypothetical protein
MVDQTSPKPKRRLAFYAIGLVAFVVAGYVAYLRSPYSDAQLHDGLVKVAETMQPSFPRKLGEHTTAVGTRVDGTTWVFLVQLTPGSEIVDQNSEDAYLRSWVCSHPQMTKVLSDGVTIRYEYSSAPPDSKVVYATDVKSCPFQHVFNIGLTSILVDFVESVLSLSLIYAIVVKMYTRQIMFRSSFKVCVWALTRIAVALFVSRGIVYAVMVETGSVKAAELFEMRLFNLSLLCLSVFIVSPYLITKDLRKYGIMKTGWIGVGGKATLTLIVVMYGTYFLFEGIYYLRS